MSKKTLAIFAFFMIIIFVVSFLFLSFRGSLPEMDYRHTVNGIGIWLPLRPTEVENINFSSVKNQLKTIDFDIQNLSNKPPDYHYREFFIYSPNTEVSYHLFDIGIYLDKTNISDVAYCKVNLIW